MRASSTLQLAGLRLRPTDKEWITAASLSVVGVTAFIVFLDCWMFRSHLPPDYVQVLTGPLAAHTPWLCLLAAMEEIKFRLLLMTAAVVALVALIRRRPPDWAMVLIVVGAQFVNVGHLVIADPGYASLRYLAVGSVWGWLYWRHGWITALAGHVSCHLLLDPLLMIGLAHTR